MLKKIYKVGRQEIWNIHRDYLTNKSELRYIFWECTMNCNFCCKHCGSSAGNKVVPETLKTEEIKSAFKDVADNFDAKKITIAVTGGEPLLRRDVFEVMKYANDFGFFWGMVTNGFLIDGDTIQKMKEAGMGTIDVSIDDIGGRHDEFRGKQGAYKKAINAVRLLSEANFLKSIRITTTIHSENIDRLEEMYKNFRNSGIDMWRILTIEPIGRTLSDNQDLLLSKDQIKKVLDFIAKKRKEDKKIRIKYGCGHYMGEKYEDEIRDYFFFCNTGINIGSILYNGDIFVCPNVPRNKDLVQGNVKKDSFSKVWREGFKEFRKEDRMSCKECLNCPKYRNCKGGSFHSWDYKKSKQKWCIERDNLYDL